MANIIEPEDILAEFLRSNTTEPTRQGIGNRTSNTTETFSGNDSLTEFTVTNDLSSVIEVTISSVKQTKYLDYQIDLYNNKITFTTPPVTGMDNISINYKYGTNWVFGDKPRIDLKRNSYPRVAVIKLIENSNPQGVSEDDTYDEITFQIDIIAYKDMILTVSSESVEGHQAAVKIARLLKNNIKNNWRSEISTKLFDPRFINLYTIDFEESKGLYRQILEVSFKSFNIGE